MVFTPQRSLPPAPPFEKAKEHSNQSLADTLPSKLTMKKSVRWSTVTVYEFGVGLGGSAVPRHGGPSIGLARKPRCVWSTPLDDAVLTERDGLNEDEAARSPPRTTKGDDKKPKRTQRRHKVRWLKPLERVTMLTKAGCSEKRIYRMMMESSEIAMSRRLTLRVLDI